MLKTILMEKQNDAGSRGDKYSSTASQPARRQCPSSGSVLIDVMHGANFWEAQLSLRLITRALHDR